MTSKVGFSSSMVVVRWVVAAGSAGVQGEGEAEQGAERRRAGDVEAAAQFLDVFAAFKHADAHAGRLGRFKRLEQALADELRIHAAAAVAQFEHRVAVYAQQFQADPAVARGGLDGVLNQVADHRSSRPGLASTTMSWSSCSSCGAGRPLALSAIA